MSEHQHIPLWKQLLGAATGAAVALVLYGGFVFTTSHASFFTAYLQSTFEGKIKNLPTYAPSPGRVRDQAMARNEELGDRVRAATAQLASSSPASSADSVPPAEVGAEVPSPAKSLNIAPPPSPKKKHKDQQSSTAKKVGGERKEEKLPDTGVPLWAIGGVSFLLAMSVRYRKELLGFRSQRGLLAQVHDDTSAL